MQPGAEPAKYEYPELDKMRMGVDYHFMVSLRGFNVTLRPLSNSEMLESFTAVQTYLSKVPPEHRTQLIHDNALALEILERASTPFGEKSPRLSKAVMDKMTTNEVLYLYGEYNTITDKVNPKLEDLPIESVVKAVDMLKKSPTSDLTQQLTELSFMQLVNLVKYLLTNEGSPTGK